ncbi:ABC transporter permease [Mycoplasmopsis columboralis]|uniref:ABC-type transport system involved in multi-copper enzyme maturation, permease component n=1 Tax=Mycoplasmopsis columboralis TaxID=171282 RepID=A0A449B6Y0_9BACT|nr:ABC transporter permease [Mycoplasmopsis columboralis]VEU76312.1 ABC-type transport system involved in multi-copper enzyme maturation, permease component [Mycoplasmopsis columboralis]
MQNILFFSKSFFKLIFKKKSTYIPLIIFVLINLIVATVNLTLQLNVYIGIWSAVFGVLFIIFTIFYASLKYLNLFKDLQEEGLELLIVSKPISRLHLNLSKLFVLYFIALINAIVLSLLFVFLQANYFSGYFLFKIFALSLVVFFFTFTIMGQITALISLKLSAKLSLFIPSFAYLGIAFGGFALLNNSTSTPNNAGYYLNLENINTQSGNQANLKSFYLNNPDSQLNIFAYGQNKELSPLQKNYIEKVFKTSKNSALEYQVYSYLMFPYWFVGSLLFNDSLLNDSNDTFLKDTLYSFKKNSLRNSYQLKNNSNLLKLNIYNGKELKDLYVVPGLYKNSGLDKGVDTQLIYARENANNFDVSFKEDEYVFAQPNNIVGSLKWDVVKDALSDEILSAYFEDFYHQHLQNKQLFKEDILTLIASEINNPDSQLFNSNTYKTKLLDENYINGKYITSLTEQKIYLAVSFIYYLYFSHNNSQTLKELLYDKETLNYRFDQLKIKIDDNTYFIGGYKQFTPIQKVVDDKIIIRYELEKSDNTLFQGQETIYQINKSSLILNDWIFIFIWVLISTSSAVLLVYLNARKDYK